MSDYDPDDERFDSEESVVSAYDPDDARFDSEESDTEPAHESAIFSQITPAITTPIIHVRLDRNAEFTETSIADALTLTEVTQNELPLSYLPWVSSILGGERVHEVLELSALKTLLTSHTDVLISELQGFRVLDVFTWIDITSG